MIRSHPQWQRFQRNDFNEEVAKDEHIGIGQAKLTFHAFLVL